MGGFIVFSSGIFSFSFFSLRKSLKRRKKKKTANEFLAQVDLGWSRDLLIERLSDFYVRLLFFSFPKGGCGND